MEYKTLKSFELSNHLGNVIAVINGNQDQSEGDLKATLLNAQDCYAFGGQMPNRSFNLVGNYRYGFNGKENDNDVKGLGNQQDYGMRIYDPRIGKFLSVDPITGQYPELTPYQFASNTPIQASDLDGLEADFSKGKVGLLPYRKDDGIEAKINIFGTNTAITIYNGIVDMAEMAVNNNPVANLFMKGRGFKKTINNTGDAVVRANEWIEQTTWKEKGEDIKEIGSNPHTYEALTGIVITHKLGKLVGPLAKAELPSLLKTETGLLSFGLVERKELVAQLGHWKLLV